MLIENGKHFSFLGNRKLKLRDIKILAMGHAHIRLNSLSKEAIRLRCKQTKTKAYERIKVTKLKFKMTNHKQTTRLETLKEKVTQLCLTLCDPMDYTVHGNL